MASLPSTMNTTQPDESSLKLMGQNQAAKVFADFGQGCEPQIEQILKDGGLMGGQGTDAMQRTLKDISSHVNCSADNDTDRQTHIHSDIAEKKVEQPEQLQPFSNKLIETVHVPCVKA